MKLWILFLSALFFLSCSQNRFDAPALRFELRLAQTETDLNLEQMTFYTTNQKFFVHDSVFLRNDDIASAEVIEWETQPKVTVFLNENGRRKFAAFTQRHIGENAAMIVDNELVSAPRINGQITKGELVIVGLFNYKEAVAIANGIVTK